MKPFLQESCLEARGVGACLCSGPGASCACPLCARYPSGVDTADIADGVSGVFSVSAWFNRGDFGYSENPAYMLTSLFSITYGQFWRNCAITVARIFALFSLFITNILAVGRGLASIQTTSRFIAIFRQTCLVPACSEDLHDLLALFKTDTAAANGQ